MDMEEQQNQVPSNPQYQFCNSMMTKLCKINKVPKINIFWWKILHNGLPMAENLKKKGCKINNYCQLYCIVDASWKSPSEKISIVWSLFSKEGTLRLQGSSAMDATDTPLVAEVVAMWEAVHQLYRLSYKMWLFKETSRDDRISEATSIIHDIEVVAVKDHFSFFHVPRSLFIVVDRLAKNARINNQDYVISWPS
ncbi:hypothetical protein N665_0096s0032 [Sinapis alba]|nr:hypothetical protein N665_0096s0032 [Sinapis alba]